MRTADGSLGTDLVRGGTVTHSIPPDDVGEYGRELVNSATATIADLDHCPRCGRRVSDYDERGRENDDGQRQCNGQCPGQPWTGRLPHTASDERDRATS
jgi:hypothetical protein